MKKFLALITIYLLAIAPPVFGLDLETAKNQGLLGETPSGYLEAVKTPSPETQALIDDINDKRKQKYQEIAARNNTSLQAVEQLAGKKAIEKSASGSYIKLGGSWRQK